MCVKFFMGSVCAHVQSAEDVLAQYLQVHSNDEWAHLFVAQYMRYFRFNKHIELLHLACAEVTASFSYQLPLPHVVSWLCRSTPPCGTCSTLPLLAVPLSALRNCTHPLKLSSPKCALRS